uniref:Uncharacterized protein n=1 Tax=Arundo donax TaxID=35708 RepID=A0A0A9DJW2_ARUDO
MLFCLDLHVLCRREIGIQDGLKHSQSFW